MRPCPRVHIGNVSARLDLAELPAEAKAPILEWFADYLSFEVEVWVGARGKPRRKVQEVSLFEEATLKFPAGLLSRLLRCAREDALDAIERGEMELAPLAHLKVQDPRVPPCPPVPGAEWPALIPWCFTQTEDRDYRWQRDAVEAAVQEGRGILSIPTGGGKTEIACAITRVLACRWLFLVPGKDLLHQAVKRFRRLTGEPVGVVGDGSWEVPDGARIVVATGQTLSRALKAREARAQEFLGGWVQGLLVDESHTLPAETFYAIARATRGAHYRLGISATPMGRTDRRSIYAVAALGPIIYRIDVPALVACGVISLPTVHAVECVQAIDRPTWQGVYGAGVVRSTQRNQLVADLALRAARPGLVFVKELQHGHELVHRLERAGLRVQFVWGAKDARQRARAVTRLERGDLDFIVCNVIFQQGVDIPTIRSVVNAAAGKSTIAAIQRVGRGTRRAEGKTTVEVWEIADTGTKILKRWTKERIQAYEAAGYPVRRWRLESGLGEKARALVEVQPTRRA